MKEHELIDIAAGNFRIDFVEAYALDCNEKVVGEGSAYVQIERNRTYLSF